ncbi:MAG: excinuclease ABC subunit UvrC [Chloroflexi bacterium]|nr:excinuclease ABC subunit UvrC [Chloroflexota bacterium]
MTSSVIKEQLRQLPASPGVYLMKDSAGTIIYVGKAASLRNRVRSYFRTGERLTPKIERMVAQVNDLEFFVTGSEKEALVLELNLIKRHRPHYNVRLKDDKTFPYLKIDVKSDWPRIFVTRRVEQDGSRYFGPFASAWSIRQTVKMLKGVFPFRSCSKPITGTDARPCLEYHIKNCVAPCTGAVTKSEYAGVVKQVIMFLEGKQETVVKQLKSKMQKAAEALDFEKAALLRDQLQAVESVLESHRIAATVRGEQDAVAFAQDKNETCVQVFLVRGGKLIGRENFTLQGTQYENEREVMTSFIKQFYDSSAYVPPQLLLQYPVQDKVVIEDWLSSKRGSRVRISVPQRGSRKQLIDTVAENARQGLEQLKIKQLAAPEATAAALDEVEKVLLLPQKPLRIEGYDISNVQGKAAVGSMVVFENGKPKPSHYRRFRIASVTGANDYAMLQEVLRRRFKRSAQKAADTARPDGWTTLPDLVLIDGGKGQLNAALASMKDLGADSIPTAGLAKENEEIYLPHRARPVVLPHSSPGLQLLQRVRDESHRFALGYHKKVHKRETFASALDGITGIGPKRKRALLKHFRSVQAIRDASPEELAAVKGMILELARKVKELL